MKRKHVHGAGVYRHIPRSKGTQPTVAASTARKHTTDSYNNQRAQTASTAAAPSPFSGIACHARQTISSVPSLRLSAAFKNSLFSSLSSPPAHSSSLSPFVSVEADFSPSTNFFGWSAGEREYHPTASHLSEIQQEKRERRITAHPPSCRLQLDQQHGKKTFFQDHHCHRRHPDTGAPVVTATVAIVECLQIQPASGVRLPCACAPLYCVRTCFFRFSPSALSC